MTWHLYESRAKPAGCKSWEVYTLCGRFEPELNALPITWITGGGTGGVMEGRGQRACEACRAAYVSRQLAIEPEA